MNESLTFDDENGIFVNESQTFDDENVIFVNESQTFDDESPTSELEFQALGLN